MYNYPLYTNNKQYLSLTDVHINNNSMYIFRKHNTKQFYFFNLDVIVHLIFSSSVPFQINPYHLYSIFPGLPFENINSRSQLENNIGTC